VRNLPYSATADELTQKFREFGEIASVVSHISDRGVAFIIYYDIRSAIQAVSQMQTFEIRGRHPVTGFLLISPENTGMDIRDCALAVFVRPVNPGRARVPHPDVIRHAMTTDGEVRGVFEVPPDGAIVEFYDVRAARKAIDASGRLSLPGAGRCAIDPYFEREDALPFPPPVFPPPPFPLPPPFQPPPAYPPQAAFPPTVAAAPIYQAPQYARPVYAIPQQYPPPVQFPVGPPSVPQEPTQEQIEREISLLREKFKSES
jgi:hypothetical protein